MTKPTAKQAEIMEMMRNGGVMEAWSALDANAFIRHPDGSFTTVRSDAPFHMQRKGLIEPCGDNWRYTTYKLTEKWQ